MNEATRARAREAHRAVDLLVERLRIAEERVQKLETLIRHSRTENEDDWGRATKLMTDIQTNQPND